MRKFLLMGCAALATLTVSAQKLSKPLQEISVENMKSVVVKNELTPKSNKMDFANAPVLHKFVSASGSKGIKKASAATMAPLYIEVALSGELNLCDSVVVSATDVQDENGNTYNVQLSFGQYNVVSDVYGQYDAAAGTLTIPAQQCYTSTNYGPAALYGVSGDEYVDNITFTCEDDGVFYLDQDAYAVVFTEGTYTGYYTYLSEGVQFRVPTHELTFYSRATGSWAEYTCAVAVQDNEYTLDVYNAFDLSSLYLYGSTISINVDDATNGVYSIPTQQNIWNMTDFVGSSYDGSATYGDYIFLHGAAETFDEDGKLESASVDDNVESFDGYLYTDGSIFFNHVFPTLSKFDSDQAAYGFWNQYFILTPLSATGINNVNADINVEKSAKTFNLAGQQVDKAYKGIVIKNGKKMIQK